MSRPAARRPRLRPCTAALALSLATAAAAHPAGSSGRSGGVPGSEEMLVRLASLEGTQRVEIRRDGGDVLGFSAEGKLVRNDRGERAPSFFVRCTTGGTLGIGERSYPGVLSVTARENGGLRVTNQVPLEEYVEGVVAAELAIWSAAPAELEAQAIATRSYALNTFARREREVGVGYVWDDVADQVYRGLFVPSAYEGSQRVARKLRVAVEATRGRVLVQAGAPLDARFSAACGGATARFEDVFPEDPPVAMPTTACGPCLVQGGRELAGADTGELDGRVAWRAVIPRSSLDRLARELGAGPTLLSLRPVKQDDRGRWIEIEVEGEHGKRRASMETLRRVLGRDRIRSARIARTVPAPGLPLADRLLIEGTGKGHGVGLCQLGAGELARKGWSAERILSAYYPRARLGRLASEANR